MAGYDGRWLMVMGGCGIPSTSTRAYHTASRAQAWQSGRQSGRLAAPGTPRGRGCAQVDGMPHEPRSGSRSVVRPFVNHSSGRSPAAQNSNKHRAPFVQLSARVGGVVAGGHDLATRSASTSNFGATAESLIQIKGRSAPAVHAPAGASAACWYYSRAHNPPLSTIWRP